MSRRGRALIGQCIGALGLVASVSLVGCGAHPWEQRNFESLVEQSDRVIAAVTALPECGHLERGGIIEWRTTLECPEYAGPALGCAHRHADPWRIEVLFEPAWGVQDSEHSALALQLCRICGYDDDREADACQLRARINYLQGTASVGSEGSALGAAEVRASAVEDLAERAADALDRADLFQARRMLERALGILEQESSTPQSWAASAPVQVHR